MKIPESIKLRNLILKPDNGSRVNWVFNCGLRISIPVGLLGVVGILWVIKARRHLDFNIPQKEDALPSFWVVPGLENLGNNCFLNVVLQALSSCVSFRNHLWEMMDEYGDENAPLVNALASLVEELCTIRHKRTVLSPRKLMLAMDHYIPNFNLAMQQDSEEALSHLLSSLREEISENCLTIKSCLAELPAIRNGRILTTKSNEEESEWQRWRRSFLKPFDGVLGSVLFCKSCSFQISLDYQLFHSLHISPLGGTNIAGCTLQDCIKQFFAAERIENYRCSNCWHNAAIGYLSAFAEDKTDIEKLQSCNTDDSCECKTLPSLEALPWSNRFSRTFKQMSIARSPKILCIHLQRASYNMLGQSVKLTGHISFPFVLDLSQFGLLNQCSGEIRHVPYPKYQTMPVDPRTLRFNASSAKGISMETGVAAEKQRNVVENGIRLEPSDSILPNPTSCINDNAEVMVPSRPQTYHLVSVVEHFGNSGSGHYTVYRKVRAKLGDEDHVGRLLESALEQWFCISDSQVDSVSEKEVLDANASLLFYERIDHI